MCRKMRRNAQECADMRRKYAENTQKDAICAERAPKMRNNTQTYAKTRLIRICKNIEMYCSCEMYSSSSAGLHRGKKSAVKNTKDPCGANYIVLAVEGTVTVAVTQQAP